MSHRLLSWLIKSPESRRNSWVLAWSWHAIFAADTPRLVSILRATHPRYWAAWVRKWNTFGDYITRCPTIIDLASRLAPISTQSFNHLPTINKKRLGLSPARSLI